MMPHEDQYQVNSDDQAEADHEQRSLEEAEAWCQENAETILKAARRNCREILGRDYL